MINNYDSFTEDLILEKILNESVIYYHPDLRMILKMIKSPISEDLLKIEGKNLEEINLTFINLDPEEGCVSFITPVNANKIIKDRYDKSIHPGHGLFKLDTDSDISLADVIPSQDPPCNIYTKSRNQIRLGKLINKLFPKKYTDSQIEEFVNLFKSTVDNKGGKFTLVEGEDIKHWYSSDNYLSFGGNLGSSCMNRPSKSGFFDIYVKNPEVCKLLILKHDDKISGRALVWKLHSVNKVGESEKIDIKYFMDRQYTLKDYDANKFKTYAASQGWSYKTMNNYKDFKNVTFKDKDLMLDMEVKLKVDDYKPYPFLDTFRRYDPKTGMMYNDDSKFFRTTDKNGFPVDQMYKWQHLLQCTEGDYLLIQ